MAYESKPFLYVVHFYTTLASSAEKPAAIPSFNAISQPDAHTQVERVGQIAAWCGVKTLVLNRIVPGMAPLRNLLQAKQNFPGNLFISDGLMQIGERSLGGVVLN
ncbi:hypothetical protein [Trichlorobacter lovleyi]|uniref:Uncharacterized protein n=1 Tax=Trichlorobacter lovleyi (strain ATCC BAA-1151 / DSM 17278 / SZ) TaxID=398767 RepID=B3EAJ8_TRIL1|nr:hypothetical protein [Trichlorobacter lovleyi]ACD95436.1 hypothetical protein Glov_1720 [Trichlorobacter lovleyi SZ]